MKRIQKTLWMIVICVCACMFTWIFAESIVEAQEKEAELFTLESARDVTVTITYEKNDISFELISPTGQVITGDTDTDNITVFSGNTSTMIFIGQAEPGTWKIKYDKGSNESIGVSADVQDSSFFITKYDVGAVTENRIPVQFSVGGAEGLSYNYKVMLTTDAQSLNGRELKSGRGRTGEEITVEVPLDNVNTYEEYYLLLYVSYELYGSEVFDYQFSESFAYTNLNMPKAMENVDVTIAHDRKLLTVNWREYVPSGIQSVFIEAYRGEECIVSAEYLRENGYTADIPYEAGDTVQLEISYKNNRGLISDVLKKEISTEDQMLTLPQSGKVASPIWTFEYKGMQNIEVTFRINQKTHVIILDGDGSKYITLPEERNDIRITYQDGEGYVHEYQKTANISRIEPIIELLRQIDGVTTNESAIMISGTTNAQTLTINGVSVDLKDGIFVHQYRLSGGANSIVIEAMIDDSVTRLVATVTKRGQTAASIDLLYLWIGLGFSVVGMILVSLLTWKRSRKLAGKSKKSGWILSAVLCWLLAAIAWVVWIFVARYVNTPEFIQVAYESLTKANRLLLLERVLMWTAIGMSLFALIRTLLGVAISKYRKKKRGGVE